MPITRFDLNSMPERYRAKLVNSLPGFKSANLIGTVNKNKVSNLSIVSSVIHLGSNPPLMAYINRPASVERHTLANILETEYFTINHVTRDMFYQAHQTSARYQACESEFLETGLGEQWLDSFPAPFVKESPLKIGLRYKEHQTLLNKTVMVIGEVSLIETERNAITDDGHIDIESLGTVTVSGLDSYHEVLPGTRLAYAKPDRKTSLK